VLKPKHRSDKKTAAKYQLFHRSQNDPSIHNPEAEDRVLYQVSGPKSEVAPSSSASTASHKASRNLAELQQQFGSESIRQNEGEAANYGVFYDDTRYDYMQHLRELGAGGGNSYFVEAAPEKGKRKAKPMKLEDALRDVSLDDSQSQVGGSANLYGSEYARTDYAPSSTASYTRKPTYQDQQNIPDAIAGFQPSMDPRLREALEALEDEAYVDDDDEDDIFSELTGNAEEMHPGDWEDTIYDEEDEGWESDVTEKAYPQPGSTVEGISTQDVVASLDSSELPEPDKPVPDTIPENGDWMREFSKFKKDAKAQNTQAASPDVASERKTAASTLFTIGGTPIRKKKRKGALTNPSAYSMTSSSLVRTEGLRLLDDRFEKVEALYSLGEEDEEYDDSFADGASMASGMTGMTGVSAVSSQAPSLVSRGGDIHYSNVPLRSDYDNVMDDFLSGWQDRSKQTKRKGAKAKRGKNGNEALGIAMLDEVRQGLGPAKIPSGHKI
jgi:protein LTV1